MITESYHLSRAERARQITNSLCLYCGSQDHLLHTCPSTTPSGEYCPYNSFCFSCPSYHLSCAERARQITNSLCLYCGSQDHLLHTCPSTTPSVKVLVDSGASGNFISSRTLQWLHIPSTNNWTIYQITTIQRKPLERISLLVLEEANVDIVLGHRWLTRPNPIINWRSGEFRKWSSRCYQECLKELPKPVITTTHLSVCSTSVESPNSSQTFFIPPEYQAFQDVFSKVTATHLPPHRPWDCAIDLLPGAKLPKGRVYPLSIPDFFFVAKKDGGLRPCINEQIVKFAYPLPLVPTTLEELRGARIFSILDLRSAYNLIRIHRGDEWKTTFITPTSHYEYLTVPRSQGTWLSSSSGEGVMSHSHLSHQPQSLVPSHPPSNWTHLEPLTCTTYKHMHSTQSAAGLKVSTLGIPTCLCSSS
ncbi:Retrotransposon-derived protein PEG10 [Labeo rohita]|uniref:Retrotransposon-derived protein PEG10 n=1 Tax=Labeo rohita TaxID=84645 RepID=A0ABQ8LAK4_LABRO|nr:Retrotransposon-derived protein PEG10 [Labeo rohita]